jgi:trimeric autotransporter adhesin
VGIGTSTPSAALDVRSTATSLQGLSTGTSGVGVLGQNTAASGATVGVKGEVSSVTGTAAVFNSQGGGDVLLGEIGGKTKFLLDKNGNMNVTDGDLNMLMGDVALFSGNVVFSDRSKQSTAASTQITAGVGLSGGGKPDATGNVMLKLDATFTDSRYLQLSGGALTGTLTGSTANFSAGLTGNNKSGDGVSGMSSSGFGLFGTSNTSDGVKGQSNTGNGVAGFSGGTQAGVSGSSASGDGVQGISNSKFGVHGTSMTGDGVVGDTTSGVGVFGQAGTGNTSIGVEGASASSGIGVAGLNTGSGTAVSGQSTTGNAVVGTSKNGGIGVEGNSTGSRGVVGNSDLKGGVVGISTSGDGIGGVSCASCSSAAAVFGSGKIAGAFNGSVIVNGTFAVSGVKAFHIDHPLDPANKYLNHFAIESNEVLNTYSGNVTTDGSGAVTVELPEYFEALNTNYRYQLTVIGQFAQAIVSQEIQNNHFVIKTDKPSVKVSWQVMGVRSDANAKAHPVPVEEDKPEQERGHYLTPEVFGQPEETSIDWLYHSDLMREAKELEQRRQAQVLTTRLH